MLEAMGSHQVKVCRIVKKLKVWQNAHRLTLDIYQASSKYPKEEAYGLTSQTRRASSSIAANIAEGCCRSTDAELARFLHISAGSASELEYHLLLAKDLHYLGQSDYDALIDSLTILKRMLIAFIKKLKA